MVLRQDNFCFGFCFKQTSLEPWLGQSLLNSLLSLWGWEGQWKKICKIPCWQGSHRGMRFLTRNESNYWYWSRLYWYIEPPLLVLWSASIGTLSRLYWYFDPPLLVLWAASIGTLSRLYWYIKPPLLVLWAPSIGSLIRLYWYFEPPLLVLWAASIGTLSRLYWYFDPPLLVLWNASSGTEV